MPIRFRKKSDVEIVEYYYYLFEIILLHILAAEIKLKNEALIVF